MSHDIQLRSKMSENAQSQPGAQIAGLLIVLTLGGCQSKPDNETVLAHTSTQQKLAESIEAPHDNVPPVFAEVIYEMGVHPLDNHELPHPSSPDRLNGYLLVRNKPGTTPILYAALGNPLSLDPNEFGFVGKQMHFHGTHTLEPYQLVENLPKNGLKWRTGSEPDFHTSMALFDLFAALRPAIEVDLMVHQDNRLRTIVAQDEFLLKVGESHVFPQHEKTIAHEDLANAFVSSLKAIGVDVIPSQQDVLRDLRREFPSKQPITLHARVSVVYHGEVQLGSFDLLEQWKVANQRAIRGPYESALAATKNVLQAVPDHKEALLLYGQLQTYLEDQVLPATIHGTIQFPAGMPTAAQEKLWKEHHGGFAFISHPDAPPEAAFRFSSVRQRGFALPAPGGKYRLTVSVPGFQKFERTLEVSGDTHVDVDLTAHP